MDKGKSSTLKKKKKPSKMFSRETFSILGVLLVVLSYSCFFSTHQIPCLEGRPLKWLQVTFSSFLMMNGKLPVFLHYVLSVPSLIRKYATLCISTQSFTIVASEYGKKILSPLNQ